MNDLIGVLATFKSAIICAEHLLLLQLFLVWRAKKHDALLEINTYLALRAGLGPIDLPHNAQKSCVKHKCQGHGILEGLLNWDLYRFIDTSALVSL